MEESAPIVSYTVKTPNFEGPLELLLELIEKRKLFINEISLASVTNEYIERMRAMGSMQLEDTTGFVLVASTLILIKSRSLLPNLALTQDEEEKISNLEARLRLYSIVKEAGAVIKEQFGAEVILLAPERSWNDPVFSPDAILTPANLLSALQDVFGRIPKKEVLPEIEVRKVMSIDEMISSLVDRIQTAMTFSFREFSKHPNPETVKEEKVYTIVSFLAMLELVREGLIDVLQDATFSDMTISKQVTETI